jgi:hypothetical protein
MTPYPDSTGDRATNFQHRSRQHPEWTLRTVIDSGETLGELVHIGPIEIANSWSKVILPLLLAKLATHPEGVAMALELTVTAKGQVTLRRAGLDHLGVIPGAKVLRRLVAIRAVRNRASRRRGRDRDARARRRLRRRRRPPRGRPCQVRTHRDVRPGLCTTSRSRQGRPSGNSAGVVTRERPSRRGTRQLILLRPLPLVFD